MIKVLSFFLLFFALYSCDHESDSPVNPVDQLPPATQIGANTFGCLLDGEVFKPGNAPNSLDCVYQFVDGGYYFSLQANRYHNDNFIGLSINTNDLEILQGQTYQLENNIGGNTYGVYYSFNTINYTNQYEVGELTITKLDLSQNIVSGTFFYNIIDNQGISHSITNGRFDIHFTQ